MLISLIVPCYNEEEAMPLFYKEASRVAAEMKTSHGADFEFIFVDDGSRDGTLRVARELHAQDDRVRYVSFSRNFGKEAGIYAYALLADGSQLCQRKYLEAAAVGENRSIPTHKFVQAAQCFDLFITWTQVQMIGVAKLHLALQIFKIDGRDSAFDGCGSSYIHKEWCLNGAVYSFKDASSGISFGF